MWDGIWTMKAFVWGVSVAFAADASQKLCTNSALLCLACLGFGASGSKLDFSAVRSRRWNKAILGAGTIEMGGEHAEVQAFHHVSQNYRSHPGVLSVRAA